MIRLVLQSNLPETAGAFREAGEGVEARLEEAVDALSSFLNEALKHDAPIGKQVEGGRTPGKLRESIRFDLEGLMATYFAVNYVEFVIGGTAAHVIAGNPALHFYWDKKGSWVTFASVKHPGTRPNDFRAPALAEAADQAETELEAIGDWVAGFFA